MNERYPGSIGMCQDPGRVFPGKRMSGHLGSVQRTTKNLEILRIDAERSLLLIKGAIPGSRGGDVVVHPSLKIARVSAKSNGGQTGKKVGT
jgi:large subunit ribosomal protein L3